MNTLAEPFCVPKRGNRDEENEDAVAPEELAQSQGSPARFAVADGATESLFARRWAKLLVEAVASGRVSVVDFSSDIASLRAESEEWVKGLDLPWYAEEKARQGAYAALIALELTAGEDESSPNGCWRAVALGDSCLFHMRGDEILVRFPLDSSTAFDCRPFLLGSIDGGTELLAEKTLRMEGCWIAGDTFYLMTDALACWFLREIEAGNKPIDALRQYADASEPARFSTWIESLRDEGGIRNDDSTLMRVAVR
jgi:hypothetical protein